MKTLLEPRKVPHKTGTATVFPYKQRQPISVQLTPEAHVIVTEHQARLGWSRNDFIEALVRQFGAKVSNTPDEAVA